jgi:hypothetical protein
LAEYHSGSPIAQGAVMESSGATSKARLVEEHQPAEGEQVFSEESHISPIFCHA